MHTECLHEMSPTSVVMYRRAIKDAKQLRARWVVGDVGTSAVVGSSPDRIMFEVMSISICRFGRLIVADLWAGSVASRRQGRLLQREDKGRGSKG
jgi:hypothetical protein